MGENDCPDKSGAVSSPSAASRYVDYGTLPPMPTPEEARYRLERIREKLGGDDDFVRMLTRQSREYGVGWLQSAMWSIDKLTLPEPSEIAAYAKQLRKEMTSKSYLHDMLTQWGDRLGDDTVQDLERK